MSYLIPTYQRLSIEFAKAKGCWLYGNDGQAYLDALCGIAVTSLGHAHPHLVDALKQQSERLWHSSNLYQINQQQQLAERLCEVAKMHSAFFCNSGTEANEAAIKLTRLYAHQRGIEHPQVIVFSGAFHGRTMGSLAAGDGIIARQGFEPHLEGFIRCQYNDLEQLKLACQQANVVAVMLELVQGEGGIHIATEAFLNGLADLVEQHQLLLVCDEIQTGMGRSGHWFAHHDTVLKPDVLTSAKALGNGFPIGACMVNHNAIDVFSAGKHGTTFGGNPLASSVALEVIKIIQEHNLIARVNELAQQFRQGLSDCLEDLPGIVEIRNKGLLIGIELDSTHYRLNEIVSTALNSQRLLINLTATKVVRLLPPYVCTDSEVEQICQRVAATLKLCQR